MAKGSAWAVFFLGVLHIVFGIVRFRRPLVDAVAAGFIGRFGDPEIRRTAFWFIWCGPFLMLAGQLAIRAVARGDHGALALVGWYALVTSVISIAAFPASPFWTLLLLSFWLLAQGA